MVSILTAIGTLMVAAQLSAGTINTTSEPFTVYVGDSRTVGLKSATDDISDNDYYIAKVGEGYKWFRDSARPELDRVIAENSDREINVVLNFGVNDLRNVDKYAEYVNTMKENLPDNVNFYYMSVNPVNNYPTVSNAQISDFNTKLESSLNDNITWIDSYSLMVENGFTAPDGLHYSKETYKDIYQIINNVL